MKIRSIAALATATALSLSLGACSSDDAKAPASDIAASSAQAAPADTADASVQKDGKADEKKADSLDFTEEGGKLVATDLGANVLNGAGVRVTVDKGAKTAHFDLLDPATEQEYANNYTFDFAAGKLKHHKFVEAMGFEFDYTIDLASGEIESILTKDGKESVDMVREQGCLDKAQADRKAERAELESYFEKAAGQSLESFVTE
ncbi:hypothetical protein CATYP_00715 [Corynebacterium atypicum]|uniref:Lipoprotein n=1 Tax=Corynebacterium atypicum TaxID=191610 RepID=A0ABM5QKZ8_9CORY|nr:hypothetical protein [Corynebacterium atypicum]AIG63456.1 hypothetical protein CATYP_00715 [Corynebacterium atypicum]